MRITKCDVCKKALKRTGEEISISVGLFLNHFDICGNCARTIMKFLETKKLVKKDEKRRK